MDDKSGFYLFSRDKGGNWYRCRKCGLLERYDPKVCPVCGGDGKMSEYVSDVLEAAAAKERKLYGEYEAAKDTEIDFLAMKRQIEMAKK